MTNIWVFLIAFTMWAGIAIYWLRLSKQLNKLTEELKVENAS